VSDLNCPYCKAGLNINHDDGFGYAEDVNHEMNCRNCDKNFVFQTRISYSHYPEKADCLNGKPHNLRMSTTYPKRYSRMHCQDCDHSEALPPELLQEVIFEEQANADRDE
jgi:hypothetical protein